MGDHFPSAQVLGIDISPLQPSWVPPNVQFQIEDAQLDWTFEPESFDFIHIRYMHGAIADWDKLYRQALAHLKPGGWIQHIEPDIELRCNNPDSIEQNKWVPGPIIFPSMTALMQHQDLQKMGAAVL
jgi:SAM-dependent methyltransferase